MLASSKRASSSVLDGTTAFSTSPAVPPPAMKVVPYIVIKGRTLTRRSHPRGEMSELASKLADRFDSVYVADEDGIFRNKPQLDVAREVCDEISTTYEAGVRFGQNVIDVFVAGADRAVVGSSTLMGLDELKRAFKLSEDITFKVDFRDGIVGFDENIAGRAFLDLARDVAEIGVTDLVVPESLAREAAAAKSKLGFSLGVLASAADRRSLESAGVDYIVCEDYGRLMDDE